MMIRDPCDRYEVENKFPVVDPARVEARLAEADAVIGPPVSQVDTYFAHPARDFAATDEVLRLRQTDTRNVLTYKGPDLDTVTRTRREIELEIGPGAEAAAGGIELLSRLGFHVVAEVRKQRRPVTMCGIDAAVTGALDEVEALGTFLELEILTDGDHLADAQRHLQETARRLALAPPEPRTYLKLLLARRG